MNRAVIIIFIILTIAVSASAVSLPQAALDESAKYLFVRESTNHNDSPEIDAMLSYIGLPKRLSWCAAYVVYAYKGAAEALSIKNPVPKIGRVSMLWDTCRARELSFKTFPASDVKSGVEKLRPGDIIVWRHGKNIKNFDGHTGLIKRQADRNGFESREGNTQPGPSGNQREGGGVYDRTRKLGLGTSFEVVGFIRIRT